MSFTVFITVLSGVLTYVIGQLVVKIVIEPVQDARRTIGQISHSLIEHANVIANPGVPSEEVMRETAQHLRKLSSQLQSHLCQQQSKTAPQQHTKSEPLVFLFIH
jgi:hypothetical protein